MIWTQATPFTFQIRSMAYCAGALPCKWPVHQGAKSSHTNIKSNADFYQSSELLIAYQGDRGWGMPLDQKVGICLGHIIYQACNLLVSLYYGGSCTTMRLLIFPRHAKTMQIIVSMQNTFTTTIISSFNYYSTMYYHHVLLYGSTTECTFWHSAP